jgi:ferritin-like metal-binding protein YciE
MEDPRDRLIRYLDDAHAAEAGIAEILQGFVDETQSVQARPVFEEHLLHTKDHALRIEKRLRELGGQPSGATNIINDLLGKISDLMHAARDPYDRTTASLIKAYGTAHIEIGMYAALAAYARAYGDHVTAGLAEQIMSEEKADADKISPLIVVCAAETFTASMQHAA